MIDCFGINSNFSRKFNEFLLIGIDEENVVKKLGNDLDLFLYIVK